MPEQAAIFYTFDLKVLKCTDYVELLNCLFIYDCLKSNLPDTFKGTFDYLKHKLNIRSASNKHLKIPKVNTTKYGLNSITFNSIITWNSLINKKVVSEEMKRIELKSSIYNYYLRKYSEN